MANNRIPRNANKIYITWKVDTTGNKSGDHATVERIEGKWIETTESGKTYYMPLALLRNAEAVQVDQIETDEPNNKKDVLLSDVGTQVYIIDGASRTDKAAQAVITALCNNGRITGELAERAKSDRATLDKIKRNMLHVQMEERETETGKRWTFYTASGVFMDIPAYSRNYITADKNGLLYSNQDTQNAPTETEITEGKEDTTTAETEPQRATETAQKTADDTTTAGSDTDRTEANQDEEKTIRTGARLYSHPHRHMVTVAGLQDGLVMVVYRGRLYLVSSADLYTDETETTPAILPAEAAQPAAVIPMENDTTSATQQAAQNAQEAHRATKAHRPIQGHTAPHKRPYRATQRAAKSIMHHSPTTATGRRPAEKCHFLAGMGSAKILDQGNHPPPILKHVFDRFLKRFLSGRKSAVGTGVKNRLQILERKIFKKILGGTMGKKQQRRLDITGMKSGKLTAVKKTGYGIDKDKKRYALWLCKCDCGGEKIVNQHTFICGKIKSCGCLRKREYNKSIYHGKSNTRIYHIHNSMKDRCYNPNDQHYQNYGGRGIKVCDSWLGADGFINFFVWSMENGYDKKLSIDRIDVNGNYEPSNCRWATVEQQVNNRRCTKRYEVNGEILQMKEIVQKYHISESTLRTRMKKGMTMQEAVNHITPKTKYSITINGETKDVFEWSIITGIPKNILVYRIKNNYNEENIFNPVRKLRRRK